MKILVIKFSQNKEINIDNLQSKILKVPEEFNAYEVILGSPFFINERKIMKFSKGLTIDNFKSKIFI